MEFNRMIYNSSEEDMELRRGPWTVEEDLALVNYITNHGEGRWNSLARCAGLKRTGKSCRLRWLNYLRPDVRRGNITAEEQLLILELHSRWGNRWSKIAQQLPGRTDNEIKNYWRTRVQKHAKQLQCDVNSTQFKDVMRYLWMPRLLERIRAASGTSQTYHHPSVALPAEPTGNHGQPQFSGSMEPSSTSTVTASDDCHGLPAAADHGMPDDQFGQWGLEPLPSPGGYDYLDFEYESGSGDAASYDNAWSLDDIFSLQHQL